MIIPGIDIVLISRMAKSLENPAFILKAFGQEEIAEQTARGSKPQGYAACFAAKEAFGKALSTGVSGFALKEVQLLHRENGAPYLSLDGAARRIAVEKNAAFSVSISHDGDYAAAVVIMEF